MTTIDLFIENTKMASSGTAFIAIVAAHNAIPLLVIRGVTNLAYAKSITRKAAQLLLCIFLTGVATFSVGSFFYSVIKFAKIPNSHTESVFQAAALASITAFLSLKIGRETMLRCLEIQDHQTTLDKWVSFPHGQDCSRTKNLIENALAHAHIGAPFSLATGQVLLLFSLLSINSHDTASEGPRIDLMLVVVAVGLATGFAIPTLAAAVNPTRALLEQCALHFSSDRTPKKRSRRIHPGKIELSRWRTHHHRNGFLIAKYLVRSISSLDRKLPPAEYDRVDSTYRQIAYEIWQRSLIIPDGKVDERYSQLCASVLGLIVNSDIVYVRYKAECLLGESSSKIEHHESRLARFFSSLDGLTQRHSRMLTMSMGFLLVCLLIGTGQFGSALEFVQQVILQAPRN